MEGAKYIIRLFTEGPKDPTQVFIAILEHLILSRPSSPPENPGYRDYITSLSKIWKADEKALVVPDVNKPDAIPIFQDINHAYGASVVNQSAPHFSKEVALAFTKAASMVTAAVKDNVVNRFVVVPIKY